MAGDTYCSYCTKEIIVQNNTYSSLLKSLCFVVNPRHVYGLGYSSLSVCVCVCVCVSVAQFGLPGDLGITICT